MAKRAATKQEKAARPQLPGAVAPEAWPAWTVERKRIGELADHPNNVRTHPVGQLAVLDQSFAEHGAVRPLVVNERGQILAGHGSRDSLLHLHGDIEIPVVVARGWTVAQERAFMLRDNAVAEMSGWDRPRLTLELVDLKSLGVPDLSALGFKAATLAKLLPTPPREGTVSQGAEAPAALRARARPGDVWLLGEHRLTCGAGDQVALLAADAAVQAWEGCAKKRALLAAGELTTQAAAARADGLADAMAVARAAEAMAA